MANLAYGDLQNMTYGDLTNGTYALQSSESGGTCLYDATAIAAIKEVVDALAVSVAALQSDVSAIKNRVNAIPTNTYSVPTVSQITTGVWGAATRTLTASPIDISALAKSTEITSLRTHGDTNWATASGFATPADVQITVNADGIDVPTVAEIWSHSSRTLTTAFPNVPTVVEIQAGLAKPGDAMTLTTAYDAAKTAAQASDVQLTTTTETVNVTTQTVDVSGLATASALAIVQTTADAIKTQTDKIPANPVVPSDIVALRTHGDDAWATADTSGLSTLTASDIPIPPTVEQIQAGLATASNMASVTTALATITALLGRWSVSNNTLTTLDGEGNTLQTYTLTRDSDGRIIGITEAGQ
ncbi:MAG: hypothetical protein Q4D98_03515 [Planctomycetia bacterium]|nr:hypothetical protein [Planctomycetia bacterium]